MDAERVFMKAPLVELAKAGFVGAPIPTQYGGAGMTNAESIVVYEETGRVCSSTRGFLAVQVGLVAQCILDWGSEEQKRAWLPRLCSMDAIGCYALTEPEAGSDVAGLTTAATLDGDSAGRITGEKWWITNGTIADVGIVFARTAAVDPKKPHRGITAFLCTDLPAERMDEPELGHRGSVHARLRFDNTPGEVLGGVGNGFRVAMSALEHGRLGVAAGAVGVHQACLDEVVAFARTRQQFGRRIGDFQLYQGDIADLATQLEASRQLCEHAARLHDAGDDNRNRVTSMAKLFCTEAAARAAGKAVLMLGARGYNNANPVERYYRDIKGLEIYEGTSHIQRLIIARDIIGKA
jgi:alkylation response protein AidB-like acyl-CoA dehydrogenase